MVNGISSTAYRSVFISLAMGDHYKPSHPDSRVVAWIQVHPFKTCIHPTELQVNSQNLYQSHWSC